MKNKIICALETSSPKHVSESLNLEYDSEYDVVLLPGWFADDGNAEIYYPEAESYSDAVKEYTSSGDWGEPTETSFVKIYTWKLGFNKTSKEVLYKNYQYISLDPEIPSCLENCDHNWSSDYKLVGGCKSNPGVWGHGAGVIINEVCTLCGCLKIVDTWAQNPLNGVQGFTSVSYSSVDIDKLTNYHAGKVPEELLQDTDSRSKEIIIHHLTYRQQNIKVNKECCTVYDWYYTYNDSDCYISTEDGRDFVFHEIDYDDLDNDDDSLINSLCDVLSLEQKIELISKAREVRQFAENFCSLLEDAVDYWVRGRIELCIDTLNQSKKEEMEYGNWERTFELAENLLGDSKILYVFE